MFYHEKQVIGNVYNRIDFLTHACMLLILSFKAIVYWAKSEEIFFNKNSDKTKIKRLERRIEELKEQLNKYENDKNNN